MELKFQTILGIFLVISIAWQINCASLSHRIRPIRDVDNNASITLSPKSDESKDVTESSHSSLTDNPDLQINTEPTKDNSNENQIKNTNIIKEKSSETNEENETVKTSNENETTESGTNDKNGRSLNIDIEKYISPEFHNKNNVYLMPSSPEIEKYLIPESQELSEETTIPPKKPTTQEDFNNLDLTTPQSNIFDSKFRLAVDKIKQNLDEMMPNNEHFKQDETSNDDDDDKYDVSKLIDNYKNADNDTEIKLHANEFKTIDLKTDKNKQNNGMESGKNVDYESKYLKTHTFEEKPEKVNETDKTILDDNNKNEANTVEIITSKPISTSTALDTDKNEAVIQETITKVSSTTSKPFGTTAVPTKKPKPQISLRNNTIETTAPDSEIKPKSMKHFTSDVSNTESEKLMFTKTTFENTINISKRGSTKFTTENPLSTTSHFMDYDNKNFSIPPTATAWTLVSLKDVPNQSTEALAETTIDTEQNSQENSLIRVQSTSSSKKEEITTESLLLPKTTKSDFRTTTDSTDSTATDNNSEHSKKYFKTTLKYTTTEIPSSEETTTEENTTPSEFTETEFTATTNSITSTFSPESSTKLEENEETTEGTTFNFDTTTSNTDLTDYTFSTITTDIYTEPSTTEITYGDLDSTTQTDFTTMSSLSQETMTTDFSFRTEKETEITTTDLTTNKPTTLSSQDEEEIDNNSGVEDNDYSEMSAKKNATDVNDPEIEIVPVDNNEQTTLKQNNISTRVVIKETTTVPTTTKSIYKNIDVENSTVDATSSTESLSHGENIDENNTGMIAAIAISSIGGICLIILAGLLLIMRKRQKRVTYGQRCRPVSLDAYSLDNVSVYNSVRRKGALRASKRSYGNPAFDDPVSISHQMNFQQLAKFVDNSEAINAEFEEIPQVTARENEVPDGCETKNRYANVIPLPETRVFLKPFDNDPHSDYINANYVTGPKNTRGYYIATQGPMNSTVDDFWRMVWEQQCRVILMLTNLYENGIEKCADYLPPSEVLDCHRLFGDFQITLKKREVKEKYIISCLQLKNMVSNSWREVTHLWYIGWPERGVPTEANSLIAFLIEARSHLKAASNNNSTTIDDKTNETPNIHISSANGSNSESGPMVVHCSPGTGRTGTVIACDIAIRDFELTRNVDIPKIVYKVRRDRASAVQTREQYSFIYKVISLYATKLTGGALDSI